MEMIACSKWGGLLELPVAVGYNNGDIICLECDNTKICTDEKEIQKQEVADEMDKR